MKLGYSHTIDRDRLDPYKAMEGERLNKLIKSGIAAQLAEHIMQSIEIKEHDLPDSKEFRAELILMPIEQYEYIGSLLSVISFAAPNVNHIVKHIKYELLNK